MATPSTKIGMLSIRTVFLLGGCLFASGCGLPKLQDIRAEYQKNVEALGGLTAVYPPREMMRIGQLWIGDASAVAKDGGLKPRHLVSMVLSDELVGEMETRRAARMSDTSRLAESPSDFSSNVGGQGSDMPFHTQKPGNTLEIATLPKYTLASVDQFTLSGSVPSPTASFLASLGFIQSKYLTMEAIAVEIAELPVDTFADVVQSACTNPTSVFGNPLKRDTVQGIGYGAMQAWWGVRQADAGDTPIAAFAPQLYLLHKIYYMRGIRYIFNDQKAASAVLSAAIANQFPAGVSPPEVQPAPLASPDTGAGTDTPAGASNAELKAMIDALNAQITTLRESLPSNSNTNIAGSYARATAQGVELVELFQRPVAFGYVAFAENLKPAAEGKWSLGIEQFCRDFGVP